MLLRRLQETVALLLRRFLPRRVKLLGAAQICHGATVAAIVDAEATDPIRHTLVEDVQEVIVINRVCVPILLQVQRAQDLVLPVGLGRVLAGQLRAMSRVGEEEVVPLLGPLDEPLEPGPDVCRCRLEVVLLLVRHQADVLVLKTEVLLQRRQLVVRVVDAATQLTAAAHVVDPHEQSLLLGRILFVDGICRVVLDVGLRVDLRRAVSEAGHQTVNLFVHVEILVGGIDVPDDAAEVLEGARPVHGTLIEDEVEGEAQELPDANKLPHTHLPRAILVVGVKELPQGRIRDWDLVIVGLILILLDEPHEVPGDVELRIASVHGLRHSPEQRGREGRPLPAGDVHLRRCKHCDHRLLHLAELHAPGVVLVKVIERLHAVLGRQEVSLAPQFARDLEHGLTELAAPTVA
mmetsp:Transcript_90787/g.282853  ORF Transcript_90787/g.282853 Transcript_90787/m.282853 type:complete len:406 (+) Transcript_90787:619-1836(+)